MKSKSPIRVAVLSAAVLAPSLAHAVVLSHDSFSGYAAGELPTQNPPVTGYTGAWTDIDFGDAEPSITAGSLVYSDPLYSGSSGDKVGVPFNNTGGEINAANSGRTFRMLDSTLAVSASTTGTVYMSFLFQSGLETGVTTYQTLHLQNGNGDGASQRTFDLGITNNSGQTGTFYNFGANGIYTSTGVAATTDVRLFVVKFELGAAAASDSVTVWVNPTLGGGGDPSGGTTVTGRDFAWDRLALSDYEGNSAAWDEVRWGTDFNSVTTVPEPASALLGSFGILALLRRRRK